MADERTSRAVMVFDGDCSFCRRWVRRWRVMTGGVVEFRPYQEAAGEFPQVRREEFGTAVHLFEEVRGGGENGEQARRLHGEGVNVERPTLNFERPTEEVAGWRVTRGAGAAFRAMWLAGRRRWLWWMYERVGVFRRAADAGYAFVAGHRDGLDRLDRTFLGKEPVSYRVTRRWFLAGLGIIYVCAFWSLLVQVVGLYGQRGILPAGEYMGMVWEAVGERGIGMGRYLMVPTVFWWGVSDVGLRACCVIGIVAGGLLLVGVAQGAMAVVCWVCYLSFVTVGQAFLGFQWDALLLEAGFLAIFLAPWTLWCGGGRPSGVMVFLVRWLVFRVMFLSGVVKLASGDPTWRTWEALKYHYETQPLPTWTAWWMHQMPGGVQKVSVGFVFLVELVVPVFVFGPRRVRVVGFGLIVLLQLIIAGTGNFGFFNWLSIMLCVFVLDDALLPGGKKSIGEEEAGVAGGGRRRASPLQRVVPVSGGWVKGIVAVVILALSVPRVLLAMGYGVSLARGVQPLEEWVGGLQVTSGYGLFAVMTTQRPEVEVEWSNDGEHWEAYRWKYKVSEVGRRPGFCEPHMPRLDWMMWFAALGGGPGESPWFGRFVERLLEGEPTVLGLLRDPPAGRPRYVRAVLYQYHFTTRQERARSGEWWRRERVGVWMPPVSGAGGGG